MAQLSWGTLCLPLWSSKEMQVCGQGQDCGIRRPVHDPYMPPFTLHWHNCVCGSVKSSCFWPFIIVFFSFSFFLFFFFLSSHLFSSGKGTWLVMMHNCLGSCFRRHGAPLTCQTTAVAMWLPLLCSFRRPAGIYSIFSKQGILPEVHSGESTSGNSHWEVRVKDFIIKKPQTNNKKHKTPNAVSFQVILWGRDCKRSREARVSLVPTQSHFFQEDIKSPFQCKPFWGRGEAEDCSNIHLVLAGIEFISQPKQWKKVREGHKAA